MSLLPFGKFSSRASLAREITVLLVVKLMALLLLFYVFFNPANRMVISSERVGQHLLSPQPDIKP